jgi:hypothetical protein
MAVDSLAEIKRIAGRTAVCAQGLEIPLLMTMAPS